MFAGMSHVQIGEELWAQAGDMGIEEAIGEYGSIENAVEAVVQFLAAVEDYDEIIDAASDPAHCIRVYLEHALGI